MRRPAPRPLSAALEATLGTATPQDLLARVQGAWPGVVGPLVASESEPISERAGTVTVACRSAVWAQELELLGGELVERLNAHLTGPAEVVRLRFRTGSGRIP